MEKKLFLITLFIGFLFLLSFILASDLVINGSVDRYTSQEIGIQFLSPTPNNTTFVGNNYFTINDVKHYLPLKLTGKNDKKGKPTYWGAMANFTSNDFIKTLNDKNIKISMDHKGRCFDNIFVERLWRTLKQEAIYYYRPASVAELSSVIDNFVDWYNNKRLHQSLEYKTPSEVYCGK
jgi:hypothetical protein